MTLDSIPADPAMPADASPPTRPAPATGAPAADPEIRPLLTDEPPVPVPFADLPASFAEAVAALASVTQVDAALALQACLGAANLPAQRLADVLMPHGAAKPLSLFLLTVAASGERKSSADRRAMAAVAAEEDRLRDEAQQAWRERKAAEREALRDREADLPPEPLDPVLRTAEVTLDGLQVLFARGQPALAVSSAEGSQFLGGHAMADDQRLRTFAYLSSMWDGESTTRVRAAAPSATAAHRRLSVSLMVQPRAALRLLKDADAEDNGLLGRFLLNHPDSLIGTRFFRKPLPDELNALERFDERVAALYAVGTPLREGTRNELDLPTLPLTEAAESRWIEFYDEVEKSLEPGGNARRVPAFGAKLAEQAARLAGTLTLLENPRARCVDEKTLSAGVALARYYLAELLRAKRSLAPTPEVARALDLADWLAEHFSKHEWVSTVEVTRFGPRHLRNTKTAKGALAMLEETRALIPASGPVTINGHKRQTAWRLNLRVEPPADLPLHLGGAA